MAIAIPIGSIRPRRGIDPAELELPGPGLYEADFAVPSWLSSALGVEFDFRREFETSFGPGQKLQHIRSAWKGDTLTIRARIVDDPSTRSTKPRIQGTGTVKQLVEAVAKHWKITVVPLIIGSLAALVREIRLFAEVSPAQAGLVAGGLLLVLTGGVFLKR